tara:strand:+ start:434 stop:1156 length:723 start_codon:yes stop_codon:yes gene_type:complete
MGKGKNIKIFLGSAYALFILVFLWILLNNFSIQDFTSYELIKANRDALEEIKKNNFFFMSIMFFLGTTMWVLLLGFGTPIVLVGGFIFGKWFGTLLAVSGLSFGATLLYIFANYFLKETIEEKFSKKFINLTDKFKKNEFIFFLVYRNIPGIPFFISNILPTLFNIKIKNFFFGTLIGMTPQLFIGVSLGAGLNKVLKENKNPPSFFDLVITPDVYLPIVGLIIAVLLGISLKKKFLLNN